MSSQTAQRVKVGMIGLAAIILLIGLASAIFSAASRDRPVEVAGGIKADAVANLTIANSVAPAGTEPLAQLGVAPSAEAADNVADPAPAPAGTRR